MVIGPTVVAGTDRVEPSSTPQALDSRVALFEPEPGGLAERTASRLGTRSPFAGGAIVGALSYVVLAALFTVIGLLLTQVVFGDGPPRGDIAVNEWFADRRTSTANTLTKIGSHLSETATVIAVAAVVVAILGMKRHWRSIAFLATGLILEVTVFLTTTLLVDRDRPEVEKLDSAPPTSSFPSGHVAAAIVLYVGIALIVATHVRSRAVARGRVVRGGGRAVRGAGFAPVPGDALPDRRRRRRPARFPRALRVAARRARRGRAGRAWQNIRERIARGGPMTTVAVIAHARKSLGGGLGELRSVLADEGVTDPIWHEVPKSKRAPKLARRVVDEGADLVFVWGGDGMVQRTVDTLAGTDAVVAIIPAGTANLLATNLGIPKDIAAAVRVGLHGRHRELDLGKVNGERFAVMAGAGFDARMIRDADRGMKDRMGRLAYIVTGAKNLSGSRVRTRIDVEGEKWFDDDASCVLFGNIGTILGGIEAFEHASPEDGRLEVGVVTADGMMQWMRTLGRTALSKAERSPFVHMTSAKRIDVKFAETTPYELDGGDRGAVKRMKVRVQPAAIRICVPDEPRS